MPLSAISWRPVLVVEEAGVSERTTDHGQVTGKLYHLRLEVASDKVYQLLAHGRWFSPGTPASYAIKTGRHYIAEILLKVVLNTKNQNHQLHLYLILGTHYIGSCRSNYHTITAMTTPTAKYNGKKANKKKNNGLQNTTQKIKD